MSDITLESNDGVAVITLNRPAKLNALTLAMYDNLGAAFDQVRDDDRIGAAILTGAGDRAFCVGADLTESIPALAEGRFDITEWDDAHLKHTRLFKPIIGAVNGLCLGGGFEILIATDLRVAADTACFGLPETSVGVVPAGGTLTRLTRQIPYAWAMELMLLGEQIDAATALRYGVLNRVVPPHGLMDEAHRIAEVLLTRSGTALEVVKRSVLELNAMQFDAAFEAEAKLGTQAFTSPDAKEGLSAFAARRPPQFPSRQAPTS
jgi:enoyl-CoA hydratase/carnithine racemase